MASQLLILTHAGPKKEQLVVVLEALDAHLVGDSTRPQQVFWYLLKNASKFTLDKGAIRISSRSKAGQIVVEVRNKRDWF